MLNVHQHLKINVQGLNEPLDVEVLHNDDFLTCIIRYEYNRPSVYMRSSTKFDMLHVVEYIVLHVKSLTPSD